MKIQLVPQRRDVPLVLEKSGETLLINGNALNLSRLPDGATLPQEAVCCDWLASDIERVNGEIHLTLILPHGAQAPHDTLFPTSLSVLQDGPISLPPYSLTEEAPADD